MQKVSALKVDNYDYNYEDVEQCVNKAPALLGGLDKIYLGRINFFRIPLSRLFFIMSGVVFFKCSLKLELWGQA